MGVLARLFGRTTDAHPNDTTGGTTHAVADGGATNDHSHHDDQPTTNDTDIVTELVDRLRNDDLTEDQHATLRRELGGLPRSHEVKFQHLQARVADFAAYSDAIEEFIDTNGTARDVAAELDDIETRLTDRIDNIEDDLTAASDARTELFNRTSSLADDLDTAETERDDLQTRLEDLETELDAAADARANITDRLDTLDTLQTDLDALENRLDNLAETHEADIADLATAREDAITDLQHTHATLQRTHRNDIQDLETTLGDIAEDMREEIDALHDDTTDLERRWNRLEGVLGNP